LRCTQGQERGFSGGLQSSYSTSEMIRKFYPKWVKYSSEITLFNLILRIKIAATYSRVVGKDLGFIGTERMTDAVVHDFTVSTVRGTTIERVKLKFTQYSQGGLVIGVKFHKSSNYKSLKYSFSYVEFSNPRFNQLLS